MITLDFLNKYFFQWFFVRLTKIVNTDKGRINKIDIESISVTENRAWSISARGNIVYKTTSWYSLMYWVAPTTGWNGGFKYLNQSGRLLKITKER